jgi:hypothetical protein
VDDQTKQAFEKIFTENEQTIYHGDHVKVQFNYREEPVNLEPSNQYFDHMKPIVREEFKVGVRICIVRTFRPSGVRGWTKW